MRNLNATDRVLIACLGAVALILIAIPDGFAQSSLGIGRNEQTLPTGGFFEGFFNWVRNQQAAFHRTMRTILVEMRNGSGSIWPLVWVCFLYGVFHAIGPGHGKVVISSYMVANDVALRRGVAISMAASLMQGFTAVAAIALFVVVLRGTGLKTGEMAYGLEVASYVGVMLVGLWLLWRKTFGLKKAMPEHAHTHDAPHTHGHGHDHNHSHIHAQHDHDHHHSHHHHHDHAHHGHGDVCDHCGHAHAPDPKDLTGSFGLREAWAAILAVGLRPCTGALIVLIFCFANSLYLAGAASTLAMSIGTGLAVSAMAIMAAIAKNAALRFAVAQESVGTVTRFIEIAAALFIFAIGFALFTAATGL